MHKHYLASAFEAGKAEGETKGQLKERRETVRSLCEVLSIEIDDARERLLSSLEAEQLSRLIQKLKGERGWPEHL